MKRVNATVVLNNLNLLQNRCQIEVVKLRTLNQKKHRLSLNAPNRGL